MTMKFSSHLAKSIRERRGLSQSEAARRVDISRQGLSNIERGESTPNATTLGDMATAYGVSPQDFYVIHDERHLTKCSRTRGRTTSEIDPEALATSAKS